jgi:hypothetical protein
MDPCDIRDGRVRAMAIIRVLIVLPQATDRIRHFRREN